MGKDPTIKRMHKDELINLLKETVDQIKEIQSFSKDIEIQKNKISETSNVINEEGGYLEKIKISFDEVNEKFEKIRNIYSEICEDTEDETSIKTQLEDLVDIFEKDKKKIEEFKDEILGYEKNNESGETEKIKGLFDKINDFHEKQQEKYNFLYNQIETELKSGATSVSLAKVFVEKVDEYKNNCDKYEKIFSGAVSILVFLFLMDNIFTGNITTINDMYLHLLQRLPFIVFAVWIVMYFGNRRAENKKLEESYKHKEVTARSFTGYKNAIEELDEDDKELLKKHMNNLLKVIAKDSSNFLNSEGEKHPLLELFTSREGRKNKSENQNKDGEKKD
jgi:hypothetical protein